MPVSIGDVGAGGGCVPIVVESVLCCDVGYTPTPIHPDIRLEVGEVSPCACIHISSHEALNVYCAGFCGLGPQA